MRRNFSILVILIIMFLVKGLFAQKLTEIRVSSTGEITSLTLDVDKNHIDKIVTDGKGIIDYMIFTYPDLTIKYVNGIISIEEIGSDLKVAYNKDGTINTIGNMKFAYHSNGTIYTMDNLKFAYNKDGSAYTIGHLLFAYRSSGAVYTINDLKFAYNKDGKAYTIGNYKFTYNSNGKIYTIGNTKFTYNKNGTINTIEGSNPGLKIIKQIN